VATDMDELSYIRLSNKDQTANWEATDKGRMFIPGVWESSHMVSLNKVVVLTLVDIVHGGDSNGGKLPLESPERSGCSGEC